MPERTGGELSDVALRECREMSRADLIRRGADNWNCEFAFRPSCRDEPMRYALQPSSHIHTLEAGKLRFAARSSSDEGGMRGTDKMRCVLYCTGLLS